MALSYAEWQRIREIVEGADDAAAVAAVLSDPNRDRVPATVVARLLDDENPLKVWREHRGLTQAQLAEAAGLPQPTIAMIETGRRKGTANQADEGNRRGARGQPRHPRGLEWRPPAIDRRASVIFTSGG